MQQPYHIYLISSYGSRDPKMQPSSVRFPTAPSPKPYRSIIQSGQPSRRPRVAIPPGYQPLPTARCTRQHGVRTALASPARSWRWQVGAGRADQAGLGRTLLYSAIACPSTPRKRGHGRQGALARAISTRRRRNSSVFCRWRSRVDEDDSLWANRFIGDTVSKSRILVSRQNADMVRPKSANKHRNTYLILLAFLHQPELYSRNPPRCMRLDPSVSVYPKLLPQPRRSLKQTMLLALVFSIIPNFFVPTFSFQTGVAYAETCDKP
jgi:hypothetical protein